MNKLLNPSLFFLCLVLMSFTINNSTELTVENLSKKWKLSHYSVGWYKEKPSKTEKNDYIQLYSNMTFSSVSEGVFEKGTWLLEGKRIILSQKGDDETLTFIVTELSAKKLTLIIDDSTDPDAKYLNIHFKN